ncbi:hypothetical protein HMPREF1153_0529 [Selenomonas sp. CM52]|nr:hypothetical protein HMPREF1153_0529 [Selenomonas sp. CM52]
MLDEIVLLFCLKSYSIARKYDIISKKRGRKRPLIVFMAEDLPRCLRYFPAPVKS